MNASFLRQPMKSQPIKQEEPPECFGSMWDNKSPECAGGADVSYAPRTANEAAGVDSRGNYIRRQCDWYQSCGARCAAKRNANGTLIPVQQVVRQQPQQQQPPPSPPQTFGQWLNRAQADYVATQQQAALHAPRPPVQQVQPPPQQPMQQQYAQPQMFVGAPVNPATTWQLNYTMPPYLSQPEVRHPGESIWAVLLREVLRAMGKSLGHSVAHFFDARPLKEHP